MMRKLYILSVAALCMAVSCRKETVVPAPPQLEQEISIKDAAVKGELLVRFTPEVAAILDEYGLTKAGVPTVEEVMAIVGDCTLERVFPKGDAENEARTKQAGLDLWYIVRFDKDRDIEQMGRALAALGQVKGVEYNHTIKRAYNADKRAIPFDPVALSAVKSGVVGPFNDPLLERQWNLVNDGSLWNRGFRAGADVNVAPAWEKCSGDPSVIVAVVDEGVFYDHPDLVASMWHNEGEIFASVNDNDGNGYPGDYYGYNFVKETGQISYSLSADTGHGTHVAGCIAAANNNGIGISSIAGGDGVNPGVRIMSCQIFSGNYVASILAEVRAIKYAADNGAVILQCSWGYTSSKANQFDWAPQYGDDDSWMTDCPIEKEALMYFIHNAGSPNGPIKGGIGVFASGNESAAAAGYPGAYGDFVSVIGTAPDFTPAVYTNYGWRANICAPGGDQDYFYDYLHNGVYGEIGCILSTVPYHISESGYAYFEGSSMATPHISAALALAVSHASATHRHLTADQYKEILYSTATPLDEYMTGNKLYYKYVADLGQNQLKKMDLGSYRGKMGAGQVNVAAMIDAIDGAGLPMRFPNVFVGVGQVAAYDLGMYFDNVSSPMRVEMENGSLASCVFEGQTLVVTGMLEGSTKAVLHVGSEKVPFVLTVKNNGAGEGWLR